MCVFFGGGGGKWGRGHNSIIPCSLTQIQVKIIILIALPIFPLVLVPELGVANIIHKDHEEERKKKMRKKKKNEDCPNQNLPAALYHDYRTWLLRPFLFSLLFYQYQFIHPIIWNILRMENSPPPPPFFFFWCKSWRFF